MGDEELLLLERSLIDRLHEGDLLARVELSAAEVTYIETRLTKPVVGIETLRDYLSRVKRTKTKFEPELVAPKVARYGELAVLTYILSPAAAESAPGTGAENVTEVFVSKEGEWRIVHTHISRLHHTLPEAVEIPLSVEIASQAYEGILGELMALEAAAMERWRQGDPWGFTEISAEEATYVDTGTPHRLDGRAAIEEEYAKRVGTIQYEVSEFLDPIVQIYGDAAVLSYRFLSTNLRPDGSIDRRMPWNCSEVYAKSEEGWRIVHTHWSLIKGRPY